MDRFKELKIVFLHFLLVTVVGDACKSPEDIQNEQPRVVKPGSTIELVAQDNSACSHGNTSYVLLYHQTSGELKRLDIQKYYRVETPPIFMNTSGIYCVHKQCGIVEMEQCCAKVTVTKMEIIFSESIPLNTMEYGICYVSTWPRIPRSSVKVATNDDSCKIKTLSVRFIDEYTTAVFFVIHVNSSCDHVTCLAPSGYDERTINISRFTDIMPSTPPDNISTIILPCAMDADASTIRNGQSGALELYRITPWVIVLTLTVFSMTFM